MKKIVDATGLACPLPVVKTKKALKEISSGNLEVIVDNKIALQNLEKMSRQLGLAYTLETINDHKHLIQIIVETDKNRENSSQQVVGSKVVVLASDQMGSGSEELGKALMKGFVYALTELDSLPDKILLYNGGVKLSLKDSDSLGDLQKLEAQGVEILNCGTCLDFFQLTDQLRVGSITNMYEIAESQMKARTIVQP